MIYHIMNAIIFILLFIPLWVIFLTLIFKGIELWVDWFDDFCCFLSTGHWPSYWRSKVDSFDSSVLYDSYIDSFLDTFR